MDEGTPRIQHTLAQLQVLPVAAVMTEAKRLARNAVKAQWQGHGRKVPWVDPRELAEATRAYLEMQRAEGVSQAAENLRQRSVRLLPKSEHSPNRLSGNPRQIDNE